MTRQLIAHVLPMEPVRQPNGILLFAGSTPEGSEVHIFHSVEQGLAILDERCHPQSPEKLVEWQESIRAAALLPVRDQVPMMIRGAPAHTIIEAIGRMPTDRDIEYDEPSDDISTHSVRVVAVTSRRPLQVYGLCLACDSAGEHVGICFSKQQVRDFLLRYNHALSHLLRRVFRVGVTEMSLPAQATEPAIEIHGFAAACIVAALEGPEPNRHKN